MRPEKSAPEAFKGKRNKVTTFVTPRWTCNTVNNENHWSVEYIPHLWNCLWGDLHWPLIITNAWNMCLLQQRRNIGPKLAKMHSLLTVKKGIGAQWICQRPKPENSTFPRYSPFSAFFLRFAFLPVFSHPFSFVSLWFCNPNVNKKTSKFMIFFTFPFVFLAVFQR